MRRPGIAATHGLLGSLVILIVAATAVGGRTGERSYQGQLVDDAAASVELEVIVDRDWPRRARFEAIDFEIECEGQPARRISFGPVGVPVIGSTYFEGRDRTLPQNDEFSYLFKFEGRLLGGGRAKGFIFYRDGDTEPPPGETYAECSTDGLLRWKAERAR